MPHPLMTNTNYPGYFDLDFSKMPHEELRRVCSLTEEAEIKPADWPMIAADLTRAVIGKLKQYDVTAVRTSSRRPYILEVCTPLGNVVQLQHRLTTGLYKLGIVDVRDEVKR